MPEIDPIKRGRPREATAASHAAIMDAVYELVQETSVRDLTMEAIAKRAKVGKPTLYKWWPSKAALVLATFHERIAGEGAAPPTGTAEQVMRIKIRHMIRVFNGLFGKVVADLIAEGQSEPAILHDLFEQHMRARRDASVADIARGVAEEEFREGTDPELVVDAIVGAIYFRLLLRQAPLTEEYGDALITQVLLGARSTNH